MINYNYNGMNAHEIAQKIIDKEKSYLKVDFDSLTFEGKCRYLCDVATLVHPAPTAKRMGWKKKFESIRPELEKQAEAGNTAALNLLGRATSYRGTNKDDIEIQCLTKALEGGYMPAGNTLCEIYRYKLGKLVKAENPDQAEIDRLIAERDRIFAKLKAYAESDGKNDTSFLYNYYYSAQTVTDDEELIATYKKQKYEKTSELLRSGSYAALTHLCVNRFFDIEETVEGKTKAVVRAVAGKDEEYSFYKTVEYIVESDLYEDGNWRPSDHLCNMLIGGIGCEPDYVRAKDIYIEEFFKHDYSKELLLKHLGLSSEEELPKFMADTFAKVLRGDISDAWKVMIAVRYGDDREALDTMCTEVLSLMDGELPARNISKAYYQYRAYCGKPEV